MLQDFEKFAILYFHAKANWPHKFPRSMNQQAEGWLTSADNINKDVFVYASSQCKELLSERTKS